MKKTKIIVPALGMLLLSTAASVTGTVAWFAVNTTVQVTGLQVRAKAEGGILIAPYALTATAITEDSGSGNTVTDASFTAPAANSFGASAATSLGISDLYPTSTATASTWYHATSNSINAATGATGSYTTFAAGTENGAGFKLDGVQVDGAGTHVDPFKNSGKYFSHTKYRVKSSNTIDTFDLYLREIAITANDSALADQNSAAMNKALRIAVKVGSHDAVFFAPKYSAAPVSPEDPLQWCSGVNAGNGTVTDATLQYGLTPNAQVGFNKVIVGNNGTADNPATTDVNEYVSAGADMDIWVYYEGEDPNCKTISVEGITIDSLNITFTFGTTAA